MPFNPAVESPIPLTQVPLLSWLPKRRGRRKIHVSTIFRWACQGLHGQRLEAIRIGGSLCTRAHGRRSIVCPERSGAAPQPRGVNAGSPSRRENPPGRRHLTAANRRASL
jgi:hypothetical protein